MKENPRLRELARVNRLAKKLETSKLSEINCFTSPTENLIMNLGRQFLTSFSLYFALLGCGGNFNQSFGRIHLNKSDYSELQCNWTIGTVGITNAFLVLSMEEIRFEYCGK